MVRRFNISILGKQMLISELIDTIIQGDCLEILKSFPDEFVDCVVTSPPYWGLRDYGEETKMIWGGDKNCEHEWNYKQFKQHSGRGDAQKSGKYSEQEPISDKELNDGFCFKCGAWYGQLGLEPTLDLYLEHLLQITTELKRILKPSGVMFWDHGDSYGGSCGGWGAKKKSDTGIQDVTKGYFGSSKQAPPTYTDKRLTPKCMAMQNYRLILKMIDEQGWILRNTIIWSKPNHMPSSVKDRFANSYEPVFMLVKNKRYWFDLDAVRIPMLLTGGGDSAVGRKELKQGEVLHKAEGYKTKIPEDQAESFGSPRARQYRKFDIEKEQKEAIEKEGKNPGDVWTIPTQPFLEAHFATYPEKLIKPMILASCPENGIVLDPFLGSGTTAVACKKLGRHYIGIELNPEYVKMANKRLNFEMLEFKETKDE